MIDGFRIKIKEKGDIEKRLCANGRIEMRGSYNPLTGEKLPYPIRGRWNGIKFFIDSDVVYLEGSLHKFYNELITGVSQNYDDFTLSNIADAIDGLKLLFGKSIEKGELTMLEMGFNCVISKSPTDFLKHDVISYRFLPPNLNKPFVNGYEKAFFRTDYRWKLYDKGAQNNLNTYLLRIEMKFTGRRVLDRANICRLLDLLEIPKLNFLFSFMSEEFKHLMIVDNFGEHLHGVELDYFVQITNTHYWADMKRQRVGKALTYKILDKRKADALLFLEKQNLRTFQYELMNMMAEKYDLLTND
jgi:hypothetical protein